MLRFLKQMAWMTIFVIGCQSAFGFALIGPVPAGGNPDDYQTTDIGYALGALTLGGTGLTTGETGTFEDNDLGTPKQIGQWYRRNTPVLYYAFDANFLNFFGQNGAAEVDKAFAVYNSLTNVSAYSADLSEFPLDSRRMNYTASTAGLLDIKSTVMGMITEQLGFWQPTRWVWALHSRNHVGTVACPEDMIYTVDKRNFDINPDSSLTNYPSSSYVNGVLYSYFIDEFCTTVIPLADAVEFPVDPLSSPYSAVADFQSFWYSGFEPGMFYTSLTRDDVGGLRYLIRTNSVARESAGARTEEFLTNSPTFITTMDLHLLSIDALTNDPVTLAGLFPGLIITSTVTNFGLLVTTNITALQVTNPYSPADAPTLTTIFRTNFATNVIPVYQETFGNVITNTFSTLGLAGTVTLGLTNSPYAPAGTPSTVVTNTKLTYVRGVFGDFFLLPTNLCSAQILSNILTTVIGTTNPPIGTGIATNGAVTTNAVVFVPGTVSFFTNHDVIYLPVTCPVDTVATRQGIEKITFIRRDYDSLVNQFWEPVTNDYTLTELTNSMWVQRHMERAVPRPDFLFTTADLTANTAFTISNTVAGATESINVTLTTTGAGSFDFFRTTVFNQANRPSSQAGPGTIESPLVLPTLFVFNQVGPLYENENPPLVPANTSFIGESTQVPFFPITWGSFDGTTNPPVVYPNTETFTGLQNALTGPTIATTFVPDATEGVAYSAQLTAIGGQPPYTWSLSPNSPALPSGLSLSTDPTTDDGDITGTPAVGTSGNGSTIYDFSVRVTDSAGVSKDVSFTITIF